MKRKSVAVLTSLFISAATTVAAASFDGKWQARTDAKPCQGRSAPTFLAFTAVVKGNDLNGTISGSGGTVKGTTTINADGSFTLTVGTTSIIGKFMGDKLDILAKSAICPDRAGRGGRAS